MECAKMQTKTPTKPHELRETMETLQRMSDSIASMMRTVDAQRELLISILNRIPQGKTRDV